MKRFLLLLVLCSSLSLQAQNPKKYLRETDDYTQETWTQALKMQQVTIDHIPLFSTKTQKKENYSLNSYTDSTSTRLLTINISPLNGTSYFFKEGKLVFVRQIKGDFHIGAAPVSPSVENTYAYFKAGKLVPANGHAPKWIRMENGREMDSLKAHALLADLEYYQDLLAKTPATGKPKETITWAPGPNDGEWPLALSWGSLKPASGNVTDSTWKDFPLQKTNLDQTIWLYQQTLDTKTYPKKGPDGHGGTTTIYYDRHKNIFYLYSDCIQGHIDYPSGPYLGNPKQLLAAPDENFDPLNED